MSGDSCSAPCSCSRGSIHCWHPHVSLRAFVFEQQASEKRFCSGKGCHKWACVTDRLATPVRSSAIVIFAACWLENLLPQDATWSLYRPLNCILLREILFTVATRTGSSRSNYSSGGFTQLFPLQALRAAFLALCVREKVAMSHWRHAQGYQLCDAACFCPVPVSECEEIVTPALLVANRRALTVNWPPLRWCQQL